MRITRPRPGAPESRGSSRLRHLRGSRSRRASCAAATSRFGSLGNHALGAATSRATWRSGSLGRLAKRRAKPPRRRRAARGAGAKPGLDVAIMLDASSGMMRGGANRSESPGTPVHLRPARRAPDSARAPALDGGAPAAGHACGGDEPPTTEASARRRRLRGRALMLARCFRCDDHAR